MLRRPLHVVADEQVQQAIAVVIEPQGGRAEGASAAQSGGLGNVDERAAAVVLKEAVLPHAGDQDIGEAVVVVIADRHAHAVHLHLQPGVLGHVGERAVAIVAIELQGAALALVARPIHAVHQQDVLPAVAIVIQKRAARPHGFGQILGAEGAAVVPEIDARRGGHVRQVEPGRRRSGPPGSRADERKPAEKEGPPVHGMLTSPLRMA